jgi:hypothetical protein
MIKQIVFLRKNPDLTMEQFMDYYENQHSQLAKKMGAPPPMPKAKRYVRRYVTIEANPLTGEKIDPGYDCIMEIWWDSRQDFEDSMKRIGDPEFIDKRKADELQLFASNSNPVVTVVEHDSPVGPDQLVPVVEPVFG